MRGIPHDRFHGSLSWETLALVSLAGAPGNQTLSSWVQPLQPVSTSASPAETAGKKRPSLNCSHPVLIQKESFISVEDAGPTAGPSNPHIMEFPEAQNKHACFFPLFILLADDVFHL